MESIRRLIIRSIGSQRKYPIFSSPSMLVRKFSGSERFKSPERKRRRRVFIHRQFSLGVLVFMLLLLFLFLSYLSVDLLKLINLHPGRFMVAEGIVPVLNSTEAFEFVNHPLSDLRPRNQYLSQSSDSYKILGKTSNHPILSVITVTKNPQPSSFRETARFIREQSLRPIRWIIVNDFSDVPGSWSLFQEARRLDPRIVILNSTHAGLPQGRMFGIDYLLKHFTKYFIALDDDDLFELTAFEKCAWMLESNRDVSFCGWHVVGFGESNFTWTRGFHEGVTAYLLDNPLTGSEMMRTEVVKTTKCGFNEDLSGGLEDWAFFLCAADKGKWGATIPERLFWYRQVPKEQHRERALTDEEKKASTRLIRQRYDGLQDRFPTGIVKPSEVFETVELEPSFTNHLGLENSIMMIIPWMAIGGADEANLNILRELSRRGYRVTIVCTIMKLDGPSRASLPQFMQFTHDIFFLPAILRLTDSPRFVSYLIHSRGVKTVFLSNSQLGYGLLPWLSSAFPKVRFIDYVHNEEKDWKRGGYAAFSSLHKTAIDWTITSSEMARQFMIDRGHNKDFSEVGYLGIDLKNLEPFSTSKRATVRKQHAIHEDSIVVVYVARMVEHKRPLIALEAFLNAMERHKKKHEARYRKALPLTLLLIGDGPKLAEVERMARKSRADVRILGTLEHDLTIEYMAISDVFCQPSLSEGLSLTLAEAMALGVAPLVSNVGGLPELVQRDRVHGIIVPINGDYDLDVTAFSNSLLDLVERPSLRLYLGQQASSRVRRMFDASTRIPALVSRIISLPRRRPVFKQTIQDISSLYYTQEEILEEIRSTSDFADIQKALAGKERGHYGTKYRATCGEYNEIMTMLIDSLENPIACNSDETIDSHSLQSDAISQCGQWCIMNLKDNSRISGWQLSAGCGGFINFNDTNHDCPKWYRSQHEK